MQLRPSEYEYLRSLNPAAPARPGGAARPAASACLFDAVAKPWRAIDPAKQWQIDRAHKERQRAAFQSCPCAACGERRRDAQRDEQRRQRRERLDRIGETAGMIIGGAFGLAMLAALLWASLMIVGHIAARNPISLTVLTSLGWAGALMWLSDQDVTRGQRIVFGVLLAIPAVIGAAMLIMAAAYGGGDASCGAGVPSRYC